MRALLLKTFCAVGMVAAVMATASAEQARPQATTRTVGAADVVPDNGISYDAGGAPYSSRQWNYDTSRDFQLGGQGLNDPANARNPSKPEDK